MLTSLKRFFGLKEEIDRAHAAPSVGVQTHHDAEDRERQRDRLRMPAELAPAEVLELLRSPEPPVLLDVREPDELRASGWIPGSIHVPMGEVRERIDEFDKSRPMVIYCASGARSFGVGTYLIENGFENVANLSGGIFSWDGEIARADEL